ncbi:hypothetical protein BBF96_08615 [Anoxybacter fermentans]|uniref:DUF3866 domain-containing protein n=1 Tax=Anoxybacter fermentans TaxID=1323375 RepID=A0A3Q9HR22_9FIRM|nr:DUF3866 family protein [Anoxybacter fermentans]AZR73438.1 hypothetical protein BBF96_08615 [Anoxybacter fermentans]
MIRIRLGQVIDIIEDYEDLVIVKVLVDGEVAKAIHYPEIGGLVKIGQKVILNTTARNLNLGTGGYHFILHVYGNDSLDPESCGHIMKLRYTPYQLKVLSVEEEESPYHAQLKKADTLAGMPVIVAPLHSMITPIAVVIKNLKPQTKIVYLMSDGGALPLAISKLVRSLKKRGFIEGTITFGHAFGGDLEAVNVYTALLAAKWVFKADIVIIAMGPGIVGTGTPYGFSGVEQANFLHAAALLCGDPIAVLRISFADSRSRHWGISHHSRIVLGKLTLIKSSIAIPELDGKKKEIIEKQLINSGIKEKHLISYFPTDQVEHVLNDDSLNLQTMGRKFSEDREFFLTAGLAGMLALHRIS